MKAQTTLTAPKRRVKLLVTAGLVVTLTLGGLATSALSEATGSTSQTGNPLGLLGAAGQQVLAAVAAPLSTSSTPTITKDIANATISRYGTRTSTTFRVTAIGTKLHYAWQHRPASGGSWKTISGATSSHYTAKASKWANGTRFRVIVTGKGGKDISSTAKLKVLRPTKTPAADADKAFGLTGLTQGVDLSAYQYTPSGKAKLSAIAAWAGKDGFTILRNGSGARPIKQSFVSICTNKTANTGTRPAVKDCAYSAFADAVHTNGLSQGHYWFNGWISSIDTTSPELFAGGFTPEASAKKFVAWLESDGHYTKKSTDPLVLDIEPGRAWTKTYKGKTYTLSLRAWKPSEAARYLSKVKQLLTADGYKANLYVYMSANAASRQSGGTYVWADVAGMARLWVASWGTNNGRIPAAQPKVGPWADHGGWSIWQYTCNARIAGDGVGALDADIAKADAWTPR